MNRFLVIIQMVCCFSGVYGQSLNEIAESSGNNGWIKFHPNINIPPSEVFEMYKSAFGLDEDDQMVLIKKEADPYGFSHYRYQQKHKGVKVEGAEFVLHAKQNKVLKGNGDIVSGLNILMEPKITEVEAIEFAKKHMNAKLYMWENEESEQRLKSILNDDSATYFPDPTLILARPNNNKSDELEYRLAYKIDIHSQVPYDGKSIYIDVQNGLVIKDSPLYINCLSGDGCTLYNGPMLQEIDTDHDGSEYRLFDDCRGSGIHTRRFGWIEEVVDDNNEWVDVSQCPGVSAHWGVERAYDYFFESHGRNSYDNAGGIINAFIENGDDDASWDRSFYTLNFGEGGGGLTNDDLVSLDIVGHEFAHAVVQSACALDVVGEPGALNESFGDIFGTAIEFFEKGDAGNYLIGEDVWIVDGYLRNMKNPKAKTGSGNDAPSPDTYLGEYWDEEEDTHFRCGVQNFWFYLLSEGSELTDGINDNGENYNITGIGIEDAAAIAYRNLTVYLTIFSDYSDARYGSIEAAIDIFGECSLEAIEVAAAWDAVGVYDAAYCQKYLTLPSTPIPSNEYEAENCISSTGFVENSSNVIMHAGKTVYLKPGFIADTGANFHAFIEGCDVGSNLVSSQNENVNVLTTAVNEEVNDQDELVRIHNFPNPFEGFMNFEFELSNASVISLEIFDVTGHLMVTPVKNQEFDQGIHFLPFNGTLLEEGIYFYRLTSEHGIITKKMILCR